MIDKHKQNIDYLKILLTNKCNLRCIYCMPSDECFHNKYLDETLSIDEYKFIIKSMASLGITRLKFTGGEPTLYSQLSELIYFAKNECNINDISITTNGIGISEKLDEFKLNGLSEINISLDSLKEYKYKFITRGADLKEVLECINISLIEGIKVNVNCVLIKDFNDDEIYDFLELIKYNQIDVRFIELSPIKEGNKIYKDGYINANEIINSIDGLYKVESQEKYYKYNNSKGRIGIVTKYSDNYYKNNNIVVTPNGKIKLSHGSQQEIDIKYYINRPMIFKEALKDIISKNNKDIV